MPPLMSQMRPALIMLIVFTLLLGGLYPLASRALVSSGLKAGAEAAIVRDRNDQIIGSTFAPADNIARNFWGPIVVPASSPCLSQPSIAVCAQIANARRQALSPNPALVPSDLVTFSAPGFSPLISLKAAEFQTHRVATARGLNDDAVDVAINQSTHDSIYNTTAGLQVNLIELNLRLDGKL